MIGGSIAGYSRTPRKVKLMIPNNRITRDITMARTGLRILTDAKLIRVDRLSSRMLPVGELFDGNEHRHAGSELQDPCGNNGVAGAEPACYLNFRCSSDSRLHTDRNDNPVFLDEDRLSLENWNNRL